MKKLVFGLIFTSGVLAGTAGMMQSFAREVSGEMEILDSKAIRLVDGAEEQEAAADSNADAAKKADRGAKKQAKKNVQEDDYWVGALIGPVPEPILVHISEDLLAEGKGVFLNEVVEGSPAEKAGLKQFDIVAKVGGEPVDPESFIEKVRESKGEKLVCEVLRTGKLQTLDLTPEVRPAQQQGFHLQPRIFRMPGNPQAQPNIEIPEMPEEMKKLLPEGMELEEMPEMFGGELLPEDLPIPDEIREMLKNQKKMFRLPNPGGVPGGIPQFQFHGGQKSHMQIEVTPNGTRVTRKMETEVDGEPLTVLSKKEGEDPAELLIEWGEESYEITEEELDSLPEEIQDHVRSLLGSGSIQIHTDGLSTQPLAPPQEAAENAAENADAVTDDGKKADQKVKSEKKKGKKKAASKKSDDITAADDAENDGAGDIPLDSKKIIDLK